MTAYNLCVAIMFIGVPAVGVTERIAMNLATGKLMALYPSIWRAHLTVKALAALEDSLDDCAFLRRTRGDVTCFFPVWRSALSPIHSHLCFGLSHQEGEPVLVQKIPWFLTRALMVLVFGAYLPLVHAFYSPRACIPVCALGLAASVSLTLQTFSNSKLARKWVVRRMQDAERASADSQE